MSEINTNILPEQDLAVATASVVNPDVNKQRANLEENAVIENLSEDEKRNLSVGIDTDNIGDAVVELAEKAEVDPEEPKSLWQQIYNDTRKHLPLGGAYLTALGHAATSMLYMFNSKHQDKADKLSLGLSKAVLSANCGIQAIEALKENRIWEAIARFIEPIFIVAEKRVEDLGLARGLGLGISQLVESQDGIRQQLMDKKGLDETRITMGQDHDLNWSAAKKLLKELMLGGFGKNRRWMTGFTPANIKNEVGSFMSKFKFSSLRHLVDFSSSGSKTEKLERFFDESGFNHIKTLCKGDTDKDKGHTSALSGYTMIIGSILGYMDKQNKGALYKYGGALRNLGGSIFADAAIFGHPDVKQNMAAPWLLVNGGLDVVQRFIPTSMNRLIKMVGNLSMAAYNIGCAIYLNRSSEKTNNKDEIIRYDTDLPSSEPVAATAA